MSGFGADVEIEWPGPSFPATSSAVPRTELDDRIRMVAVDEGAKMMLGAEPLMCAMIRLAGCRLWY